MNINIFDIRLCKVCDPHQDMDLDRLMELKFCHKNIFMKNFYKVSILFVWNTTCDNLNKKFYKEGFLFFAEHNNILIENSTKFSQGFPLSNTFKHEFLVKKVNLDSLRFFIKINHEEGYIRLIDNSNLIQLEEL
jgi:hypothetical protein